jgi:hypothetical protein
MIGLVSRLTAAARGADVDRDGEGVFWVTRNECRTCGERIADPERQPTEVDTSSAIANMAASSEEPRSTFCSEVCHEEFVEVFQRG